jgi:CRISPR-associated endonuclease/helicase Cas3
MIDFKKYLAKPSGITLDDHINNVISEGDSLISEQFTFVEKYKKFFNKDLKIRIETVCRLHDFNKIDTIWQTACQEDYNKFMIWQKTNTNCTYLDYYKTGKSGLNLRNIHYRHELNILKNVPNLNKNSILLTAILSHHSKLNHKYIYDNNKNFNKYEKTAINIILNEETKLNKLNLTNFIKKQYEYSAIRSYLRLADHRASIKENNPNHTISNLIKFNYNFKYESKTEIQNEILKNLDCDLILVRSNTGSGKTDAALLFANYQIMNNKADRLIIAMPTRFTSNALAINISENLSELGLYHSTAYNTDFKNTIIDAKMFLTPITVCTIDYLLRILTLSKEKFHLAITNLANSCLVIDELDFYDDYSKQNILFLLKYLKELNVKVLMMSASLPDSMINDYKNLNFGKFKFLDKIINNKKIDIKSILEYDNLDDLKNIFNKIIKKGKGIIYANTVNSAILIYDWFKNNTDDEYKIILYHSIFTEKDKIQKEKELLNYLGKNSDKHTKCIAILTQIGELSINISSDIMISMLCPIDRLIQRLGRLGRFDFNVIGECYIIKSKSDDYCVPYGEYDIKEKCWISNKYFDKTYDILKTIRYEQSDLIDILNKVYDKSEFSEESIKNADNLEKIYRKNGLILSNIDDSDDDGITYNDWYSRNMMKKIKIFLNISDGFVFLNYEDFDKYVFENSFEINQYLIKKLKDNDRIEEISIFIKTKRINIFVLKDNTEYNYYSGFMI